MGINININVNGGPSAKNAREVSDALKDVAPAGVAAAKAAGGARREFAQLAGAFVQMTVGKQLVDMFAGFALATDKVTMGMQSIKSVMEESFGAGEEQKLKMRIMSVAETTGKSFKDVAEVTKNLIAQGLSPEQADVLLMPLMKFAKVGDVTVEKATDLTVALTNMGIGAGSVGNALDVMFNMARKTSLETKDFVNVMTTAAPAASNYGLSFNELATTAGFLRKSFSSAQKEATSLFQTLQFLERTKPEAKIKAAFGVDVVDQMTGKWKPILTLISEINHAMLSGKGSMSDISDIFGGKSGAAVFQGGVATLRQGMNFNGKQLFGDELIKTMRETPGVSGGAVSQGFDEIMKALMPQIDRLSTAFQNLIATLGTGFADSLIDGVKWLANMVSSFNELLNNSPALKAFFSFIAEHLAKIAAFVGVFAILGGGASILSTALMPVIMNFRRLVTSIIGVGAAGKIAGAAVGGMWRSLLGPLALILMVVDIIPSILKFFGIGQDMTDKSLEASKIIRDSALSNQGAANAMQNAAASLEAATKEYQELVVEYDHMMLQTAPKFDPRIQGVIADAITKWAAVKGGQTAMGGQAAVAAIREEFGYINRHEQAPAAVTDAATTAARIVGNAAVFLDGLNTPGAKREAAQIRDFLKNRGTAASKQNIQFTKDDIALFQGRNPMIPGAPFVDPDLRAAENYLNNQKANIDTRKAMGHAPDNVNNLTIPGLTPWTKTTTTLPGGSFTGRVLRYDPVQLHIGGDAVDGVMTGVQQHKDVTEMDSQ